MAQAKVLNEKEIRKVLLYIAAHKHSARNRAMFLLTTNCGLRAKEVAALRLCDVLTVEGKIREEFYKNVKVPGGMTGVNTELEKATRVADFIELGELMCLDALDRDESCGGHFREEFQTEEGEALRVDDKYSYVAAWEFTGDPSAPKLNKEDLIYENIKVQQRSYK